MKQIGTIHTSSNSINISTTIFKLSQCVPAVLLVGLFIVCEIINVSLCVESKAELYQNKYINVRTGNNSKQYSGQSKQSNK